MLDHMGSHAYPPANRGRLVLWGLLASFPFGGMTWQVLHHLAAMRRLGFDVWYVEDTNRHMRDLRTYEPTRSCAANIEHAVKWLEMIGLEDRFIIREPCTRVFHGGDGDALARLYEEADAVFNLCGAQEHRRLHDVIRCAVYIETDPVEAQVDVAKGRPRALKHLDAHHHHFTYAANLGSPDCPIPASRYRWHHARPPVVVDWWASPPTKPPGPFSTVANWRSPGKSVLWDGRRYSWRKDLAFRRVIRLPELVSVDLELALDGISETDCAVLRDFGWNVRRATELAEPDRYRDFIRRSAGEITVAKDRYVRTRSGWFSDRSVCYLAGGRPVVTEDTGFGRTVPTGEGLLAFRTVDEAAAAIDTVNADYRRHAATASEIAREYFDAERQLRLMLETIGLL